MYALINIALYYSEPDPNCDERALAPWIISSLHSTREDALRQAEALNRHPHARVGSTYAVIPLPAGGPALRKELSHA